MKTKLCFILLILSMIMAACTSTDNGPTSPPLPWDTNEYRANYGLALIHARPVYENGGTGKGVTIAVIDTGLDADHPEFTGRISPKSANLENPSTPDTRKSAWDTKDDYHSGQYHGTRVASVAAAAHGYLSTAGSANFAKPQNVHGVAFESTIMAIDAWTEASHYSESENDGFYSADVSRAIDYAVENGANIINLSMGGPEGFGLHLQEAITDAAAAGVAVVISTGNDRGANAIYPARYAGGTDSNGLVLAVMSPDTTGRRRAGFSNKCDGVADLNYCLAAPGQNIYVADVGGGYTHVNGTSFSAPHVAGAIALLMDALGISAAEAIERILANTTDIGAHGVDETFGKGMLNLEQAFKALGALHTDPTDPDSSVETAKIISAAAFGDALSAQLKLANLQLYDEQGVAYQADLRARIITPAHDGIKYTSFIPHGADKEMHNAPFDLSKFSGHMLVAQTQQESGRIQSELHGVMANYAISGDIMMYFGTGQYAKQRANFDFLDEANNSFGMTNAAFNPLGYLTDGDHLIALKAQRRNWQINYRFTAQTENFKTAGFAINAQRKFDNGLFVGAQSDVIFEDGSFIGSKTQGLFDGGSHTKTFGGTFAIGYQIKDMAVYGQYAQAYSHLSAKATTLLTDFSTIGTRANVIGLSKKRIFDQNDRLSFTISNPLKVVHGTARINADLWEEDDPNIGLTPSGTQRNFELSYKTHIDPNTQMGLGFAYIKDAGHIANTQNQWGIGIMLDHRF